MTRAVFSQRIGQIMLSGRDVLAMAGTKVHRGGRDYVLIRCPAPDHPDRHPSCSVNLDSGRARCFACGWWAKDVVGLHAALHGHDTMGDALEALLQRPGVAVPDLHIVSPAGSPRSSRRWRPVGRPVVVKTWSYLDADGSPAFDVERVQFRSGESWVTKPGHMKPYKEYRQVHPDGYPRCLPDRYKAGLRPLYRLPEIMTLDKGTTIFVVEGEPATDALIREGIAATTSSAGSGSARLTDWSPLAGRPVVIWPDNDTAGARYEHEVIKILGQNDPPAIVRVIDVSQLGLPDGGDAVDWLSTRAAR